APRGRWDVYLVNCDRRVSPKAVLSPPPQAALLVSRMYSQGRRCRFVRISRNFLLNRCITGYDPYTANLDHAHGQDPNRSPATTEPFPLEAHSVSPALRARRMDRPHRPQGDND